LTGSRFCRFALGHFNSYGAGESMVWGHRLPANGSVA
jgi:hypothetical protein